MGVLFGSLMGNVGAGLCFGVGVGLCLGTAMDAAHQQKQPKDDQKPREEEEKTE